MKLLFSEIRGNLASRISKKVSLITIIAFIILIVSILVSNNLASPEQPGYLELLDVQDARIQSIHYKIFYLKWHGKTTELEFTLYKRTKVAGYAVPGGVGAQWNKTNGDVISVKDGNVCKVKDGDKFKLSLSIFATYIKISYDNKTVWFYGSGEMEGIP